MYGSACTGSVFWSRMTTAFQKNFPLLETVCYREALSGVYLADMCLHFLLAVKSDNKTHRDGLQLCILVEPIFKQWECCRPPVVPQQCLSGLCTSFTERLF